MSTRKKQVTQPPKPPEVSLGDLIIREYGISNALRDLELAVESMRKQRAALRALIGKTRGDAPAPPPTDTRDAEAVAARQIVEAVRNLDYGRQKAVIKAAAILSGVDVSIL